MARDDGDYVVYRGEEPDLAPISLRTRLVFVGIVLLVFVLGGLVVFRSTLFPPPPPPKAVTESITEGSRYARYDLDGEASRLAVAGRDVWAILPERREAVKFDVSANRVSARVKLPQTPNDLAVGVGGVWVSGRTAVYRLDSSTGRVIDEVASGNVPGDITIQGRSVWVVNTGDDTLSRIDSERGRVTATIPIAPAAFDVAATRRNVWVAHGAIEDGAVAAPSVTRVDTADDRVGDEIDVSGDLRGVAVTDSRLWTIHGRSRGLGEYSTADGRQIGESLRPLPGPPSHIYEANRRFYAVITGQPSRILTLDRSTGRTLASRDVDDRPIEDIVANASGIWIVRRGTDELVRLQTCTPADPCRVRTVERS